MQSGEFLEFTDRLAMVQQFGAPYYSFHRADLVDALAGPLDRNTIHLGHRLTGVEERDDRAILSFANGSQVNAEFLIGADGVRSVVRQALYGADNPTYTGQMVWRALLKAETVPPESLEPHGHTQWIGPGRHFIAYYIRGGKRTHGSRKAGRSVAIPTKCARASRTPSRGSPSCLVS
jgi:salicylate hydroxylase